MAASGVSRSRGEIAGGWNGPASWSAGVASASARSQSYGDAELYLALDAREDRRAGPRQAQVSLASTIKLEWLEELFPENVRRERLTRYDDRGDGVISANQLWYHDLLLREDPSASVNPGEAGLVLAEVLVAAGGQSDPCPAPGRPLAGSTGFRQPGPARTGLESTSMTRPWRRSSPRSVREKRASTKSNRPISSLFCRASSRRDRSASSMRAAPETITIPSGRQVRLTYEIGRPPILAARLQELFGWTETPRLARGRVPVLLHLLGPNNRPVQITDDLRSFWTTTYHQVRKDLRRRYPKHPWPEDPFAAQPSVRGKPT